MQALHKFLILITIAMTMRMIGQPPSPRMNENGRFLLKIVKVNFLKKKEYVSKDNAKIFLKNIYFQGQSLILA